MNRSQTASFSELDHVRRERVVRMKVIQRAENPSQRVCEPLRRARTHSRVRIADEDDFNGRGQDSGLRCFGVRRG